MQALKSLSREIRPEKWAELCRRINESDSPHIVSIRLQDEGAWKLIAERAMLRAITFQQQRGECSDRLTIEASSGEERPFQHMIIEPIHLRFRASGPGRYNQLEIIAESGATQVEFHPGFIPSMIDGLD